MSILFYYSWIAPPVSPVKIDLYLHNHGCVRVFINICCSSYRLTWYAYDTNNLQLRTGIILFRSCFRNVFAIFLYGYSYIRTGRSPSRIFVHATNQSYSEKKFYNDIPSGKSGNQDFLRVRTDGEPYRKHRVFLYSIDASFGTLNKKNCLEKCRLLLRPYRIEHRW